MVFFFICMKFLFILCDNFPTKTVYTLIIICNKILFKLMHEDIYIFLNPETFRMFLMI